MHYININRCYFKILIKKYFFSDEFEVFAIQSYTERNNSINLQYKRFFTLSEDFMSTLHDFTCMGLCNCTRC